MTLLAVAMLGADAVAGSLQSDLRSEPPRLCPRAALPLSRADFPAARAAALRRVKRQYGDDAVGATARAALAPTTIRGGYAKLKCGRAVWRRTAVVFVFLPRMLPSASLSTPVYYASRTPRGWTVWFQIH